MLTHAHLCRHCDTSWPCTLDVLIVYWKGKPVCTHDPDVREPRNHGCGEQLAYTERMQAMMMSKTVDKLSGEWSIIHPYGRTAGQSVIREYDRKQSQGQITVLDK